MADFAAIYNRWWVTTLIICSYGFFKEMRPSEPYLTECLTKYNNITKTEAYQDVYPVWTYAYLGLLVLVFLCTDLVRYKPMIVFEALGYIATWALLIWGSGVTQMQMMEFFYGIATSTEVAYYTYIYARVEVSYYQRVTGYVRAAILAGKFASGVLSQSLVGSGALDYHSLNYISFTSVSVAACIAISLPPVRHSIYFHRPLASETEAVGEEQLGFGQRCRRAASLLACDLRIAYSTPSVLQWSVWWAFATCGNLQVGNYVQPLWEEIAPWEDFDSEGALYNGLVEASNTLLGAAAALMLGHLRLNWDVLGEPTLALFTFVAGALLLTMALTSQIAVAYVTYVFFRVIYQMLITVCSFQVAKAIPPNSYGLVFGVNTFLALLLETLLTVAVVEDVGFGLAPRPQFQIYGGYFLDLGVLFIVLWLVTIRREGWDRWRQQPKWLPTNVQPQEKDF